MYRFYSTTVKLPKRRGELLYGLAPCLAALQVRRRRIYSIITQNGFAEGGNGRKHSLNQLVNDKVNISVKKHDTQLFRLDKSDISRLVGKKPHQGIVLDVEPLNFKSINSINLFKDYSSGSSNMPLWLLLYQVQDPMNFGAILRCAYFFGVDKVIVTAKNSCVLSPVVSKASAGAMEHICVYSILDVTGMLKEAVSLGWSVMAASNLHSETELPPIVACNDVNIVGPTILVLGNEGHGLPKDITGTCTSRLTIYPLRNLPLGFDSLNVSVATGILLHSLQNNKTNNNTVI